MSIYTEAVRLGLCIDSHESDLYLKSCPESDDLAKKEPNAQLFQDSTGAFWWDIPFMYDPWWEQRIPDARVKTNRSNGLSFSDD